ncbi:MULTISPECIES: ABC transporter ATP-binding protein [Alphaproteobacteria]|uniref:ABC transporter ATP-binding protein n=2 Tax=Alphaproteobacteria TaxID=28211 RepID=A0A512HPI6_9HYPH|nr:MULTISPECIES: ABC transporter ATP-binding protein [Alphaproteobacteria]GEO87378.1 ABC transporter ATP-binding protein [Ciceribacter naphthalenivorans]GLR23107.1 ABC transporter ATP-binding protein [Ciceribacter naphthalenivorans]GLT05963.1 ABC transporter ATP-binding protein [Sphingomonas psychrolutea]
MSALNAMGIKKSFGGQRVLDDAWIDVPEQWIVGLIGPNGAGKSTFLTVLSKFIEPDAGVITSRNMDVTTRSPHALSRAGVVRTFQVPHEFSELSVMQNMMVAVKNQAGESIWQALLLPHRVSAEEKVIRARAGEWLEFLGLDHVAANAARNLSGGQKKLLELGRALMTDPYLLLLDEPFAGVAPGLVDTIIEKILELQKRGLGFLIVEHNMDAVNALCNTVFVMERGRILTDGAPQKIVNDPRVLEAYLGGKL